MNLDSVEKLRKVDRENMLELLVSFSKQCEDALFIGNHAKIPASYKRSFSNIVFTGLGGSAIGADLIRGYIEDEVTIPLIVNRNYTLPHFVNGGSLLFAVSYSGNTEETLAAYAEAKKKHAHVVVITSGGKLKELALKNGDAMAVIPKGYPPRCALGYSSIPAIVVLSKLGIIKNKNTEIKETAEFLEQLQKKSLAPHVKGGHNIAKNIAHKIYTGFPVIYASSRMESVVTRWRGQIAENSKTLASAHVFPEMNHNEIVGWAHPKKILRNFVVIILRDSGDLARIKKRMDITSAILRRDGFRVLEVESQGKGVFQRMLSLIYTGDFVSFYLAVLSKTDPTPVDRIAYLKKQLAR